MVVVRSMELTQKKTTLSFKALDGILRTTDPTTGERVSMSHKCGELDRQIPQLMGVGKAILEHVVFCHQEDSNWPLREGSELKKRFDDIFDSTRYAKVRRQTAVADMSWSWCLPDMALTTQLRMKFMSNHTNIFHRYVYYRMHRRLKLFRKQEKSMLRCRKS